MDMDITRTATSEYPTIEQVTGVSATRGSGNATADRMAVEANRRVREIVQEIITTLQDTHRGRGHHELVMAVQRRWSELVGDAAPPLSDHQAFEYARHISEGNRVMVVSADGIDLPPVVSSASRHALRPAASRPSSRRPVARPRFLPSAKNS